MIEGTEERADCMPKLGYIGKKVLLVFKTFFDIKTDKFLNIFLNKSKYLIFIIKQ